MKTTYRSNILFICLMFLLPLMAQADKVTGSFRHYSTEDGLSHDGVLCMECDREGFMWFGTWDGLNRFDGNNFITYKARPGDNSILKNNKVRDFIEDKTGFLWVTTYDNKTYRFDKKSEAFWAVNQTSSGENLESIVVEKVKALQNGDVWLFTEDQGLVCAVYDKNLPKPIIYHFSEKNGGLPSDQVNFIVEDDLGKLWIGTSKGLVAFVKVGNGYRKAITFGQGSHVLTGGAFVSAAVTPDKLYFGTTNGRLYIYHVSGKQFTLSRQQSNLVFNAIQPTKSGRIYLGTNSGLFEYDILKAKIQHIPVSGRTDLHSIYEDSKGNLWIEPAYDGIIRYNPQEQIFQLLRQKREKNVPGIIDYRSSEDKNYKVQEDVNGILWANLKGGGFGYYNEAENAISYLYNEPGASDQQLSNDVECFYSDPSGVLWLSTRLGGVHKFILSTKSFSHVLLQPLSKNRYENEVRAIFEDSQKRLWVCTKIGGIYLFNEKMEPLPLPVKDAAQQNFGNVYAVAETRNGVLLFGTKGQGLVVLTPKDQQRNFYTMKRYLHNENPFSISGNMIYAVMEDSKGRVWIGTFGGGIDEAVFTSGGLTFRNYRNFFKKYPIKTGNVIRNLGEDDQGNIWIATTNGILRFQPEQNQEAVFQHIQKIPGDKHSLGNNDVLCIYKDIRKNLWVGTFGGGLNKVIGKPGLNEPVKFEVFTREQGLSNDIVMNLINDENGNLWMATENGLSRYNVEKKAFRNFDSFDGLPKSGFSESGCVLSSSGRLFFGGIKGFVSFDPAKLKAKRLKINLALTNLQLYNNDVQVGTENSPLKQALNQSKELRLKHDQNVLNIDYSVLDYRTSHNFSYAYILEGFDKDWHYVKSQKRASYTKLPPGHYTFKVKSLNPDLFSNTPAKSLAIVIMPPWYQTIWAYLIYLVLLIIGVFIARNIIITMIRLRNKVVLEHKLTELKLSFFTNISHELRTPLTLIVNPLRQIEKTEQLSKKGKEYISVVNKNANRMVRFINQLLDFRKIQSGKVQLKISEQEIVNFVKGMAAYFSDVVDEKQVKLKINSNQESCRVWMDEEKMDIVLYNLISNAFKFTPKGKQIEVNIECREAEISIRITDQGIGVPEGQLADIFKLYFEGEHSQAQKGTGIGLALAKEIMTAHHGDIIAGNNVGEGMYFEVKLLKGNQHFAENELNDVSKKKEEADLPLTELVPDDIKIEADSAATHFFEEAANKKNLVLLVEDNTDLRSFLADQLTSNFQVLQAEDGEVGFMLAKKHVPDLILSDVMMPNMDGMEMLEKLKSDMETSHIPVILLTAKSSVENQMSGLQHGADLYLTKPFHTEHVLIAVENLIKQRKKLYDKYVGQYHTLKLEPGEITITSKDEAFLKQVISIVEEGMADPKFNIDAVASAVSLGRTTFFKKLKSLTDMSPVEFVRDIRLKRGKQLMDTQQYSVSEIAYMIGFSSAGYFSTCFRDAYGISPSEYLKNLNS